MQFYISVMFLGLPDDIHEEKPSFLQSKKNALRTDGRTDGPTDRRTDRPTNRRTDRPSYRDARTHLKRVFEHFYQGNLHGLLKTMSRSYSLTSTLAAALACSAHLYMRVCPSVGWSVGHILLFLFVLFLVDHINSIFLSQTRSF